jgi:lysophospholipase L1-like esterase
VGDSITHGRIGINYAEMVQEQMVDEIEVVNAGVNSELVWNALQRVDEIIACNPDYVTILLGTNDANSVTSTSTTKDYIRRMKLPQTPTRDWYRDSLSQLVERLSRETDARIGIISIPPIGESPQNPEYLISKEYAAVSRQVAQDLNVAYLPLFERMDEYVSAHPITPSYCFDRSYLGMLKAIFSHYSFGRDWDSISEKCGFHFHIDYLHLNSNGASAVASLVTDFIKNAA